MPQATVHLLRHGEVHNPDGVLYGRLPEFHLSELGREMARTLAEHFRERSAQGARIVHLAASPLTRAQETAQPIADALGLEIATESRIIEAANYFEGLRVSKAELLRPKHWARLYNPLRPSWVSRTRSRPRGSSRPSRTHAAGPSSWAATGPKPSLSATSCPSGPRGSAPKAGRCGTTRASANAP